MPSKPVAMTVTVISSSMFSSKVAPQMMLASSWARSVTIWEAVSISSRAMSGEEVMLMITPLAPEILVSSRGLDTAARAACWALSLPLAWPTPMWA